MAVKLLKREGTELTYEVKITLDGSMLGMEESIQQVVNQLGQQATGASLSEFDTDGGSIEVSGVKYTSKGAEKKNITHPMEK
jgi:hypothetical protein